MRSRPDEIILQQTRMRPTWRTTKVVSASLFVRPTSGHLFEVLIMLLADLLDAIDAFPEPFSIVSNEIYCLQRLCASRFGLRGGICGGSLLLTSG